MEQKPASHMTDDERNEHIAHLLGISIDEFKQLHHSGLKEVTDSELQVYKYFIQFTKDSPPDILDKLDVDAQNTVYFSATEWEKEKRD
jgi:hypothetical protein